MLSNVYALGTGLNKVYASLEREIGISLELSSVQPPLGMLLSILEPEAKDISGNKSFERG
jgi:hypothetical protein